MIDKKIYFIWDGGFKRFCPTGSLPHEKMRDTPKQGYGIFQIATWLDIEIDYSKAKVNNWINDLKSAESDLGDIYANAILLCMIGEYIFLYNIYNRGGEVLLSREQFLYILEQYGAFLNQEKTYEECFPQPIDVEIIAEGKDAFDIYSKLIGINLDYEIGL